MKSLQEIAEDIDRKFQLAISAVRCDGATPTGSYRDTILRALREAQRDALREAAENLPVHGHTYMEMYSYLLQRADALKAKE